MQFGRRAAALLELLAAAAGAGFIAAHLGAQAPRPFALGHSQPQRQPEGMHLQQAAFDLLRQRCTLCRGAGQLLLFGRYVVGAQQTNGPVPLPAVRKIVRASAADDYKFQSVILGVVNSVPFRMKTAESTN